MLVYALMWVVLSFFNLCTSGLAIPLLPSEAWNYLNIAFEYICSGAGILANYMPFSYLMTLFMVVVTVDLGIKLYHLIMWIIKKIPVLDIK